MAATRRQVLRGVLAVGAVGCAPAAKERARDTALGGGLDTAGEGGGGTGPVDSAVDTGAGGRACVPLEAQGLGPCTAEAPDRSDLTEGQDGIGLHLDLRVRAAPGCGPVAGAWVAVWHASPGGIYSGETPSPNCQNGDASAREASWFRGSDTTDGEGRVTFFTRFPGWYPGRTPHLHLQIVVGDRAFATQLYFEEEAIDELYASDPRYAARGERDTTNRADGLWRALDDPATNTLPLEPRGDQAWSAAADLVLPELA
jgi:protocatechuate 3,4-dioxygenase beta subunit